MKKTIKLLIRVVLFPVAFILHLIPHCIGITITMYRWVRYGGEFVVYKNDDKETIHKLFIELKKIQAELNDR